MIFTPTAIRGAVLISLRPNTDERGFFARAWCARECRDAGLPTRIVQSSISWNKRRHTLRGMHWQAAPHGEGKIVRCTRGAIFDVIVDLRPTSRTYLANLGFELDADNRRALYVPPGLAHGFLTLTDGTEVLYQMDTAYVPDAARGARWNDPAFAISWPHEPEVINDRDATFADYAPEFVAAGSGPWT